MSSFSSWILSIACISVASVLVDLVLPEGKSSVIIKSVFSYAIILVIVSPIPKLLKSESGFSGDIYYQDMEIQEEFIYQINKNKIDKLKSQIENDLIEQEIEGVEIAISADIFELSMKIDAVYVDFFDLVINENNEHIDIKKAVINTVQKYILIGKESIVFDG